MGHLSRALGFFGKDKGGKVGTEGWIPIAVPVFMTSKNGPHVMDP